MVRTETLKSFVKMHESKLNAKMSGMRASQLESEFQGVAGQEASYGSAGAGQHWSLNEADMESRRRPKSRYFNFILTSSHN